jgi:uncharacterized protein (TIGR01777 family)
MPTTHHLAVTGATGLLGTALRASLPADFRVTPLVRRAPTADEVRWDPATPADLSPLGPVDAVVHLAGENLAAGRWTDARKAAILTSRRDATASLVASLLRLPRPPKTFISASAVGIYGDRGDETLTESSAPGSGFLAEVARAWEEACAPAAAAGIRVLNFRFGVVLTPDGGALSRMLPPFRLGLGGPLGPGRQWMSWITLEDAVQAILFGVRTDPLRGPINAVAPEPVTNRDFARALGRALHRPALLPVPAAALRLIFGELADATLLSSQRAIPERLTAAGFRFRSPALPDALTHLLA